MASIDFIYLACFANHLGRLNGNRREETNRFEGKIQRCDVGYCLGTRRPEVKSGIDHDSIWS